MTQSASLERLVAIAAEPSSERRRELLREVTDLFLASPDSYNSRENTYFGEIMGKVAFDLEQQIREELAEKLAAESAAPPDLIRQLAQDDIAVARPVLEQSPVLEEQDLIDVAAKHGQGHLLAITKRPDITQAVSEVLVERGDDNVVEGLIGNDKAQLSRKTMEVVVHRAQTSERLQAPLVHRADLPKELMGELVEHVSNELRQKILQQTDMIAPEQLDRVMKGVEGKYKDKAEQQEDGNSKPEALINRLHEARQLKEETLVQFARSRQIPEFICGIAKLAEIDIPTAKHSIFNKNHEGLAIICRALDFDRSSFSTFVTMANPVKSRAIDDTYDLLRSYDRLTKETAQRILRFWRVRKLANKPAAQSGDGAAQPLSA